MHRSLKVLYIAGSGRSGSTSTVNAARALRRAGFTIDHVATLLAIDHPVPVLWQRMAAEQLTLHVGVRLPPGYAPRPLDQEMG